MAKDGKSHRGGLGVFSIKGEKYQQVVGSDAPAPPSLHGVRGQWQATSDRLREPKCGEETRVQGGGENKHDRGVWEERHN